jgi:hypothetical protein
LFFLVFEHLKRNCGWGMGQIQKRLFGQSFGQEVQK